MAILAAILCGAASANAQTGYTFTVIADWGTCGGYQGVTSPSINNSGTVAFIEGCPTPNPGPSARIRRTAGGPLETLYEIVPTADEILNFGGYGVSLNDAGVVSFIVYDHDPLSFDDPHWLMTADGTTVTTLATAPTAAFRAFANSDINNAGDVVFHAVLPSEGVNEGIYIHRSGTNVPIAATGMVLPHTGQTITPFQPQINDLGVVMFSASGLSGSAIFTSSGDGQFTIIGTGDGSINGFAPGNFPTVNNHNEVAFLGGPTEAVQGVMVGAGGPFRVVATTGSGFYETAVPVINDAGTVAFLATLYPGQICCGIYIGPDPATDKVIGPGDAIPGLGVVENVAMHTEAINNSGQIAFVAGYRTPGGDRAYAIVRAEPPPPPSCSYTLAPAAVTVLGSAGTTTASLATTASTCAWTASTDAPWLTISAGGTSGSGNQAFTVAYATNTAPQPRVGTFTAGGRTLTVTQSAQTVVEAPQPPKNLFASSIVGNVLTLRFTPPLAGPVPTGYLLDGGLTPGSTIASIPTGSTAPIFTISAPNGSFYLRMRTLTGTGPSGPSNEIRLFIDTTTPPSAPVNLLATVNGGNLSLAWKNTFAGGKPTSLILDASGTLSGSVPIPLGEQVSFGGVPAGTYTLSLRAVNSGGGSGSSNVVTVTIPSACTGAPLTPADFLAYKVGNRVTVLWDPAASGPAPTSFVLGVTGSFVGNLALPGRSISANAPPGTYNFTVRAVNACGASAPTTEQTVTIP